MNDLDSSTPGYEELASPTANWGDGWWPIGEFQGSLNGQGYEIRDLSISRPDENYVGLFREIGKGGRIARIGVVNITVVGADEVGGLTGYNRGIISDCCAAGSVTGGMAVGGLVGANGNTVNHSCSTSSVSGEVAVGGLVGLNDAIISDCCAAGSVSGGYDAVGGLVGINHAGTVSNSYATGNVTGNSTVGGLVGLNAGNVGNSYSTGRVTGNASIGGLVGANSSDGSESSSFWDIETSGQATSAGGTGKNTTEMQDIATFSDAGWNIIAVALNETNPAYIWNIVNNVTYPFLSWQP